ncbi:tartrate dehydrogenase/decarboxylase / D-malate dehydrogenase [Amycolatopsis tolypomycina]|uniref:D-malate dehydrogenase (decarboxylating) n=1 Tax=Amycolatopsis tolypomycina TaxID=208445 RepID=A0A1H4TYQ7_9PSEU|nr:tartrate dehydrogenase [Amycolatopsis tolypomycina]SEC61625.1 tartrate dehydrogenase/decarboxylase / D-malate dehydrogenase [Amycolatopsis tolypomycina]
MSQRYRIAAILGDGIGREVVPEGLRCLRAAAEAHGFELDVVEHDFACADHWLRHGAMLPPDWKDVLGGFDAIFFGAVGWPEVVPDHVSLWGSLLQFRRGFDQYVNLRPVRLLRGVRSPLRDHGPGDIDFRVVRENTEGEYSNVGGRIFEGTDRETVLQETVLTRIGVDRVLRYAFDLAAGRPRKHLTWATKSNGISIAMPYWDERAAAMAKQYPDVVADKDHIDILAAKFVLRPGQYDVVVASNLFGDILSDLGPACAGTIGIAPSANINPDRTWPSLFEPVHGSAPDIAGRGIANPVGQIWSGAMMLEHLGEPAAAAAVLAAIERVLADRPEVLTPDLGGPGTTEGLGTAIAAEIAWAGRQEDQPVQVCRGLS